MCNKVLIFVVCSWTARLRKKSENNHVTILGGRGFPHVTPQTNQTARYRCVLNFQPLERVHRESPHTHTQFERRRVLLNNRDFVTENGRKKIIRNMDLDSMKYAELQSLAKELGLKANMKVL